FPCRRWVAPCQARCTEYRSIRRGCQTGRLADCRPGSGACHWSRLRQRGPFRKLISTARLVWPVGYDGELSMKPFADDVRFAFRSLRRVPAFVATTIAILAIGVGATTAVWSVAAVVLLRDLPIRDQGRVITLWATAPGSASEIPTLNAR